MTVIDRGGGGMRIISVPAVVSFLCGYALWVLCHYSVIRFSDILSLKVLYFDTDLCSFLFYVLLYSYCNQYLVFTHGHGVP